MRYACENIDTIAAMMISIFTFWKIQAEEQERERSQSMEQQKNQRREKELQEFITISKEMGSFWI